MEPGDVPGRPLRTFEWDPAKNRENRLKHNLDFEGAIRAFDGRVRIIPDDREEYGEDRWIALGLLDLQVIVIVFTEPDDMTIRVIRQDRRGDMSNGSSSKVSGSDWARADALTDEEIDTSDIPEVTPEMFARGVWRNRSTERVALDIDSVILAWFKAYGDDWQKHVNAALHQYLLAHLDDERDPQPTSPDSTRR